MFKDKLRSGEVIYDMIVIFSVSVIYQTIKVFGLSEVLLWFRDGAFNDGRWELG